jgi:hypothetical protein
MAATGTSTEGLRIGEALKRARTGQGIDARTAEERTKIRIKYLRALESEDWDVLPSPAYTKGFLRTYATMLGLDAEALVDEYRRQVESRLPDHRRYSVGEPVLERRVRPWESEDRRISGRAWLGLAIAAGAAGLIVIALSGGDEGRPGHRATGHHHGHNAGNHHHAHQAGQGGSEPAGQPVRLELEARQDVQVCLVNGAGDALIDAQALNAGSTSGPFQPADRFRLDLESGGIVALTLDGEHQLVASRRPASFQIDSAGVHRTDFRGHRCP